MGKTLGDGGPFKNQTHLHLIWVFIGYVLGISFPSLKGSIFMVNVGKHGAYGYRSEFFFRLFHEMFWEVEGFWSLIGFALVNLLTVLLMVQKSCSSWYGEYPIIYKDLYSQPVQDFSINSMILEELALGWWIYSDSIDGLVLLRRHEIWWCYWR